MQCRAALILFQWIVIQPKSYPNFGIEAEKLQSGVFSLSVLSLVSFSLGSQYYFQAVLLSYTFSECS